MIRLWLGDCNIRLGELSEVRAFVTDPPYGLSFMSKEFDTLKSVWKTFEGIPESWLEEFGCNPEESVGADAIKLLAFQGEPVQPLNWMDLVQAALEEKELPAPIYQEAASQQDWVHGGGFSKPGIGERDRDWPSFTGSHPIHGNANPTCADCGGRLRGAKKCTCPQPHDHWKPLGPPRTGALDTRQPGDPNYTRTSVPLFDRAKVRHSSAESYGGSAHQEMQAWHKQWLEKCYAALVPGGVIKVFSATRTFHRLAVAMEEVGFLLVPGESLEAWAYGCLSEDAEILTDKGWKPGLEVEVGERVNCWNPTTGKTCWEAVEEITIAPYSGKMIAFRSQATDQLLTPNHRVYHQKNGSWQVHEARKLPDGKAVALPVKTRWGIGWTWAIPEKVDNYEGLVWCVKVPTGAFVARRNGMVFITGNSGFPKSLNIHKKLVEMAQDDTEALAQADRFQGMGTALKPAWEPFLVGRKPYPLYQVQLETKTSTYCYEVCCDVGDEVDLARQHLSEIVGQEEAEQAHVGGCCVIGISLEYGACLKP